MELIFNDYGIEILKNNDKYYIRYDSGELASVQKIIEINKEDANRAQKSEADAYFVILEKEHKKNDKCVERTSNKSGEKNRNKGGQ